MLKKSPCKNCINKNKDKNNCLSDCAKIQNLQEEHLFSKKIYLTTGNDSDGSLTAIAQSV